jgi:Protein of unknown function (DUF2752)
MRAVWRHRAPAEIDHELIWVITSISGGALAAAWLTLGLPWPRCAFLALTGHPCLTCGATRAAIQFLHGHLSASWHFNPLAFVAYCAIALFDCYAGVVLLLRLPRLRVTDFTAAQRKLVRLSVVGLLALNWIYLLKTA